MTLTNESSKEYFSIIEKAKELNRIKGKEYYENHHIIPRALGGTDDKDNLVLLIPEEHYICHSLLPDFCEGIDRYKMICAWRFMNDTMDIDISIIGPEKYSMLKKEYCLVNSKQQKIRFQTPIGKEQAKKHSKYLLDFFQTEEGLEYSRLESEAKKVFYQTEEGKVSIQKAVATKQAFFQTEEGKIFAKLNGENQKAFALTEEGKDHYEKNGLLISKAQLVYYQTPTGKAKAKRHSEKMKNLPKKECPHCGRSFDPGNYIQHIDKYCKVLYPKKG